MPQSRFLSRSSSVVVLTLAAWFCAFQFAQAASYDGKLQILVVDEQTGEPIAARIELRNSRGRSVRIKSSDAINREGFTVFDGTLDLELRKGDYRFVIEAGPEYQTRPGHFTIERHADDSKTVSLRRHVNMRDEGWWAGDLDVSHRLQDVPLMMRAEGLDFVPVTAQGNFRGKCSEEKQKANSLQHSLSSPLAGPWATLDYRRGGGLLFLGSETLSGVCRFADQDSSLDSINMAHETGAEVIALSPSAWDLPLWIATGDLSAIQIIHRHSKFDGKGDDKKWGRPRDKVFFPGKLGVGRYSEEIYHHVLNCGLRIPPGAGSGAGANKNPVGTNRVYVQCGSEFSRESWLDHLRSGQVMVTNGPLLRTTVEGHPPGHVFEMDQGEVRVFLIALSLSFYEKAPVEYLEIVKNGRVEFEVRLDELAKNRGRLPPLKFDESGWFLVRAVTSNPDTYQFASTGPYYVEANYQRRVSRASVQYFLDWLTAATVEFADNEQVLNDLTAAKPFWQELMNQANAD